VYEVVEMGAILHFVLCSTNLKIEEFFLNWVKGKSQKRVIGIIYTVCLFFSCPGKEEAFQTLRPELLVIVHNRHFELVPRAKTIDHSRSSASQKSNNIG
jgi:hypothetical protein